MKGVPVDWNETAKRLVKGLLTMRFMSNSTKDLQHNGERGHNEFCANVRNSEVEDSVGVRAVRRSCPLLTNSIGVKGFVLALSYVITHALYSYAY